MKRETPIAERLKHARKMAGMRQQELADKCAISRQSITLYETEFREPDASVLKRMAGALGVSADWLLGMEGETEVQKIPEAGEEIITYVCTYKEKMSVQERLRLIAILAGGGVKNDG